MGRLFKALGIFIGVILLLIVAAAVVIPMVVDPNDFKDEIVKKVHEQTGRELKIAGDLDLSVFPWLGVQVDGVELGNAKGFGKLPFAAIKHASLRVKLMPLLEKKLEIDTIGLEGVALNLVRKSDGASNWDGLDKSNKEETASNTQEGKQGPGLESFAIGGIAIKDASISWDDRQSGQQLAISDFNLNSGAIVPGNPVKLSMGMKVQSKDPAINAMVGLDGSVELDQSHKQLNVRGLKVRLDADGPALPQGKLKAHLESTLLLALSGQAFALLDLKIISGDLNLTGEIKGAKLGTDTPQFSGKIAIAEFSPRDWMTSQGMEPPKMADRKAMSKLAASLTLNSSGVSTKINKLAIQLDDTRINGNAVIQGKAAAFKLDMDAIDIDRYLAADSDKSDTVTSGKPEPSSAGEQLIPVETIRSLDMSGTITIGKLTINKMPAEKVQIGLKARNGVLETTQKIGSFSGGNYGGSLNINASGKTPTLKLTSKLSGVRLEILIKNLAGEDRINGEGNFNADLTASGNSIDSIKRTLNGKMDFNLLKGAIKGINLAAELRKAKALLSGKKVPKENGPVQTDFSQIKGSATIKNGVMHNDDLQALSPFFRVTGKGTANLVKERLDYTANVYVVETSKGQGGHDLAGLDELERKKIGVPVHFTGSFSNPKWKVKWDKVLLESQKEELKSKLEEKLIGEEKKDGEEESDKDKLKRKLLRKIIR